MSEMYVRLHVKYTSFLLEFMKHELLPTHFGKTLRTSNATNSHVVGAVLLLADLNAGGEKNRDRQAHGQT